MPLAPRRYCAYPGCSVLVAKGRCAPHAVAREHTRRNRDVRQWYCSVRWFALRRELLVDAAYTCAHCGIIHTDLAVDHIIKHEGNPEMFWNRANLQTLCFRCHSKKTASGA
jgi:5-methylcytosine-specific restriction enzyme A